MRTFIITVLTLIAIQAQAWAWGTASRDLTGDGLFGLFGEEIYRISVTHDTPALMGGDVYYKYLHAAQEAKPLSDLDASFAAWSKKNKHDYGDIFTKKFLPRLTAYIRPDQPALAGRLDYSETVRMLVIKIDSTYTLVKMVVFGKDIDANKALVDRNFDESAFLYNTETGLLAGVTRDVLFGSNEPLHPLFKETGKFENTEVCPGTGDGCNYSGDGGPGGDRIKAPIAWYYKSVGKNLDMNDLTTYCLNLRAAIDRPALTMYARYLRPYPNKPPCDGQALGQGNEFCSSKGAAARDFFKASFTGRGYAWHFAPKFETVPNIASRYVTEGRKSVYFRDFSALIDANSINNSGTFTINKRQ